MDSNQNLKKLAQFGLYSPDREHDACGVGVVADIKGRKSHQIIEEGLVVLVNLGHRGAAGRDPETGDGAGILVQMPHQLFLRESPKLGVDLPPAGGYGVGMVFLPPDPEPAAACQKLLEDSITGAGLELLGWRDVPVDKTKLGQDANACCPAIRQVFVGMGKS